MKVSTLFVLVFVVFNLKAQVVFSESFDEADDAITGMDAIALTAWTTTCPGSMAATDYLKVVGNKLEARDTNSPGAEFTTSPFDIEVCTGLEITLDIEELGDMDDCATCTGTGTTCIDWVKLEYNIDGAGWTEIAGASCAATMTEAPGEMIQIGEIPGGGPITYTSPCIDFGTSMQIRVSCMSWAGTEYWIFDNIEVSCNDCVLPVEIVDFDVHDQTCEKTQLNWSTLSERENKGFVIERSYEGVTFDSIGKVNGMGNSSNLIPYSFTDRTFHPEGVVYYRLKQIDFNGAVKYSKIVSAYITAPASIDYLNDEIRYQLNKQPAQHLNINIYTLGGLLLHQFPVENSGAISWSKRGFFIVEIPDLGYRQKLVIP